MLFQRMIRPFWEKSLWLQALLLEKKDKLLWWVRWLWGEDPVTQEVCKQKQGMQSILGPRTASV